MKSIFFGLWFFYIALFGENVFAQEHEIENKEYILNTKSYNEHNFVNNINERRTKRQTEQDNNEFIKQLSSIAMEAINGLSNYGHKLIEVEKIDNVSRTFDQNKIKISACRFNDLNQKEEIGNHPEKNVTWNDFFSPVGDYQSVDVNNENIQKLAHFALDSITQQTMSKRSLGLDRVVSAKFQVVAGINYKINLLVCEIDSIKNDNVILDYKKCRSCNITIWEQSWLNNRNVTKVTCFKTSALTLLPNVAVTKRDIHEKISVDTKINMDINDKKVQDIVTYALLSVNQQLGFEKPHMLSKVINATKQIVPVIMYNIELEICENFTSTVDDKKCRICNVNIWEHLWESNKNTSKMNCNDSYKIKIDASNAENFTTKKNVDRYLLKEDFNNFINTHNKMYSSLEEKNKRFHIFAANMKKVKLLQNNEQGTAIYGATQFADLTKNEFKKKYLGLNPSLAGNKQLPMAEIPDLDFVPDEFDWRNNNAVTPVKNQGSCGSCWAFSAIANIEGQFALKSGKLLSLSEQELIDCDNLDNGCGGGLMTQAFEAVENLGGLETEIDYPYEGHADRKGCQLEKSEIKVSISKAVNISTDEVDMAKFLVKHGPLSVGVNANAMQFYMGGVSHPIHALCSPKSLDHGVAIVGYGVHRTKYTHKNLPYWLIKNSWGPGWGEKGYYLLYRGDGSCGVNQMVSSAIIE